MANAVWTEGAASYNHRRFDRYGVIGRGHRSIRARSAASSTGAEDNQAGFRSAQYATGKRDLLGHMGPSGWQWTCGVLRGIARDLLPDELARSRVTLRRVRLLRRVAERGRLLHRRDIRPSSGSSHFEPHESSEEHQRYWSVMAPGLLQPRYTGMYGEATAAEPMARDG